MAFENPVRLLPAECPDRYLCIRSGSCHSPIPQEGNGVHRIRMKAKDLLCGFGLERPSNGGGIEAARQNVVAVTRNRNCPHGATMTRQLRSRWRCLDREQGNNDHAETGAGIWEQTHRLPTDRPRYVVRGQAGYLLTLDRRQRAEPSCGFHVAPHGRNGRYSMPQQVRLETNIARSYARVARRGRRHANTTWNVSASSLAVAITSQFDPATRS